MLNVPLIVVLGHDSCGAVKATLAALDDGEVPGGYVLDIVERITPSILLGRNEGLTRVDEFEARHVTATAKQLVSRSKAVSDAVESGQAGHRRCDLPSGRRSGGSSRTRGRHRRRLTGDTPGEVRRLCVSWPYRSLVLETEPHHPLPPEIYRRRRFLAIGVGALVLVIVIAIVVVVFANSTGGDSTATQPSPTAAPSATQLPGANPEVKTPILPPAQQSPAADPDSASRPSCHRRC